MSRPPLGLLVRNRQVHRTLRFLLALLVVVAASVPRAAAQPAGPLAFGSSADPLEAPSPGADDASRALVAAGPAFLGAQWTIGLAAEADVRRGALSVGAGGTVHLDEDGLEEHEVDELYDLARAVRYVRLEPTARRPVYARLGPPRGIELGTGHLVRGYQTTTAWDERTLGLEAAASAGLGSAVAFVDDVRLSGVVGGYATFTPAGGAASPRLRTLQIGLGAVHDLGLPADAATTGVQADARVTFLELGGLALQPWVSYAEYLRYGRGVGLGADVAAADLGGSAHARVRLAAFVSSDGFIPGYVNAFYAVANVRDRIVEADAYYGSDSTALEPVGVPLDEARGGVDLVGEIRLVAFGAFELVQHVRRHVGGGAPQSAYGARLAVRPSGVVEGLEVDVAFERQGFRGVFGLFGALGDQNALVLDVDYPLGRRALLSLRSRYGYRRLDDAPGDGARYLVQRRFEPLFGLRLAL